MKDITKLIVLILLWFLLTAIISAGITFFVWFCTPGVAFRELATLPTGITSFLMTVVGLPTMGSMLFNEK